MHSSKRRLMSGSSLIRGEQIADYLGAKYNPESGYQDDVCIYVKPAMKPDASPDVQFEGKPYIDLIDYREYISWLRDNPKLSGIVASQYSYDFLKKTKLSNKIVLIPQQHCNFERLIRDRQEITNVGIIGAPRTFQYPIDEIRQRLDKIGLNLIVKEDFETRADVVNFYQTIDIQIVWDKVYRLLKTPLKIINAASFGIPTIGYPHKGYKEVDGQYIKALTIDQLVTEVEKLKNQAVYEKFAKGLLPMADKYHISQIVELYKKL